MRPWNLQVQEAMRAGCVELGLGANRIRDAEASELAAALTDHASEKLHLGLEHNALSAAGLAGLRKLLPHGCTVTAHFQQPRCVFVSDLAKSGFVTQVITR